MENESNKTIIINFVRAINDHDVNEIINLMSEDHVFIDATDHKTTGKNVMWEGWKEYYKLFPDYRIDISDVIENEHVCALFGYASGTYKNLTNELNSNFWRIPAAWKAITANSLIKHWQVYCDYSSLFKIIEKIH